MICRDTLVFRGFHTICTFGNAYNPSLTPCRRIHNVHPSMTYGIGDGTTVWWCAALMKGVILLLLLLSPALLFAFNLFGGDSEPIFDIESRFERRKQLVHSFKNPFYLVRGTISFWTALGSTVITNDYVRLTPAEKSRAGSIWNTKATTFDNWEVEMSFKAGSAAALGADGFAVWYTKESRREGNVFGNQDQWDGLAVVFDTFDNDGGSDNPSINVFRNDGTWSYNSGQDGKHQSLGTCRLYYRNYETHIKMTYVEGKLQILTKLQNQNDWNVCTTVSLHLPSGYYFGITAATGGLVDNHDIYRFETTRLVSLAEGGSPNSANQGYTPPPVYENYGRNRNPVQQNEYQEERNEEQNTPATAEPAVAPVEEKREEAARTEGLAKAEPVANIEVNVAAATPAKAVTSDQVPSVLATLSRDVEVLGKNQASLQQSLGGVQSALNTFNQQLNKDSERLDAITEQQKTFSQSFENFINGLPTKNDLKSLNFDNSDFSRELNALKAQMEELRRTIESKASNAISSSQVDALTRSINEIRGKLETSRQQQQQIENNLKSNQAQIHSSIESSGSLSFWIFFILFQVVFGVSFMWWKKYRDESSKKFI
ncbi:hypothetical protein PROFUN_02401 [Planoprotostelium fungivorum]|uniref:L-type lectin-like domain-containing protein n=1 Tax=Planoprotostelium fungivorum TaxID=1890364 RepID=A0A2P6NUR0_9EUKA|nr:hypothetical protein PROFUN_02401 [Planoprotostelium fungivorum]